MSSVPAKKLEKRSVLKSNHTGGARIIHVALRFTIHDKFSRAHEFVVDRAEYA